MTLNDHVDARLNELRPDRYECGDLTWADDVIDEIGEQLTLTEARIIAGRKIVADRERLMVQSANRLIRRAAGGEHPIAWLEALNLPIVVGDERVRLAAASPADLDQFADEETARATRDYDTRMETVKVARDLARRMRLQGVPQLHLLADEVAAVKA